MSVHYNFGAQLLPLPFKCRTIVEALQKDATVLPPPAQPKDGKRDVIFPVCLPDEGTFDWLDTYLEKNPQYTELSDRAILSWAEKSGLTRAKGYATRTSNDKPEMGFSIGTMDDGSIRRVLQAISPTQQRDYIVMEVKSNLLKEERKENLSKWSASKFKRTALVMMGSPPPDFQKRSQDLLLKQKQETSDAEFRAKREEDQRKRQVEKRKRQLERDRKKQAAEVKRKIEIEKKKREA